jgi:NADPH-dependent 2,4-dienoyl-CoA reductase/sulfur reductase-like enzyme
VSSVVIVGAGPAGIRAACTLVEHGLRPIVIDEARLAGGQGYRRPPPALSLDIKRLMGCEYGKYEALHRDFDALHDKIDYRPRTLVWAIDGNMLYLISDGRPSTQTFDKLILATGAMDKVAPLPGATLPGVFTLGGAQIALKDQGCLIGRRVAFVGSSPLLTLAAKQYRQMGAEIALIADTTPLKNKIRELPTLAKSPRTLMRGIAYQAQALASGTPILSGVTSIAIEGATRVEGVRVTTASGRERTIACDAVALGYGLKPETQLADLAGARFAYDALFNLWLPVTDADGRAADNLYLAGDGAAIGGADAAEASGALAACAVLTDLQIAVPISTMQGLRRTVSRLRAFQRGLAGAFAWPRHMIRQLPDDLTLCRCEDVSVGDVRTAMRREIAPVEINRVKAITRCGMGRCQGRVCGPALQEIVAEAAHCSGTAAGRLRGQAPIKPIALAAGSEP